MTRQFLVEHTGDNRVGTKTIRKEYDPNKDAELLNEEKLVFRSFDDDYHKVSIKKYEIQDIDLPEYITESILVENAIFIQFIKGYGFNFKMPVADYFFNRLLKAHRDEELTMLQIYAIIQLFNTKTFKSTFRQSIFTQIVDWLTDTTPKYKSPLSQNQWEAVLKYDKRNYDHLSRKIYNDSHAGKIAM